MTENNYKSLVQIFFTLFTGEPIEIIEIVTSVDLQVVTHNHRNHLNL